MSQPIPSIPVVDVDQAFPLLTSDGNRSPAAPGSSDGTVSPVVENALRDVLGWRPRPQDSSAFEAALTASFQLSDVEDHTVATYSARGYAMQADLGAVSGGQASLYSRAVSARTQILTLLDGLSPLRPDADQENCESYRKLVRDAVTPMISELGTPGGPRVAVVDAFLRQLLGAKPASIHAATTADNVGGQLGQVREQFGLTDAFVNNIDQEGVRTAFWTMVDLVLDINRAWVNLSGQFSGTSQGFLGTDLVLISQLLAAVAEQVDDVEAALDSVSISIAERQTIPVSSSSRRTVDGLLSWVRTVVTEEGPRIARDTGRDGIRTSLMPTVLELVNQVALLLAATTGRLTFRLPGRVYSLFTRPRPVPRPIVQAPLITVGPRASMPPGMQSSRVQIAVTGLDSLLWQLAQLTTQIAKFTGAYLFDVVAMTAPRTKEMLVVVRGLNIQPTFMPVFRCPGAKQRKPPLNKQVQPKSGRVSHDSDTVSAVFDLNTLDPWLNQFVKVTGGKRPWPQSSGKGVHPRLVQARYVPIRLRDDLTGRLVQNQTNP